MKIELVQPNPDFALVWVYAPLMANDQTLIEMERVLSKTGYTMLGRWEPRVEGGKVVGLKAPALKESEHIKPPRRRTTNKK